MEVLLPSWPGLITDVFVGFLQSIMTNAGILPQTRTHPHSSPSFPRHRSSQHSTLYDLNDMKDF